MLWDGKLLKSADAEVAEKAKPAPGVPFKIARIPAIERNIALGPRLIELKAKSRGNNDFSRLRAKHFPNVEQKLATEAAAVARMYGRRPEIFRRLSWRALVELSAPSLPAAHRSQFEARILAGEDVKAKEIAHARGPLPIGRPRRSERPAGRMAA